MRTRTILTNTGFNVAGMVITSLIALAVTPLLLRELGPELFGVWALFGVVVALSQLLDLGLGRALVRNLAQYRLLGRWSAAGADVNSLLWPLMAFSLTVSVAGMVAAAPLARTLGVPAALDGVAVPTLRLLFLSLPPMCGVLIFGAMVEGSQRMAYTSVGTIVNRALFAGGALMVVAAGGGLMGVAGSYVLAVSAQCLLLLLAVRRVVPALRYSPALIDTRLLRRDWRFARFVFATSVIALGFTTTNKVLLARWTGVGSVAYYELAVVVATQVFTLALAVAQALYPAFSATYASGGSLEVRRLYVRSLRLLALLVYPVAGIMVALAGPFVAAWFDRSIPEASIGLQSLTIAWAVAGMAAAASVGLQAVGRPGFAMSFSAYNLVVNLVLALLLVPVWGFWGLIAANVIAVSSSAVLTLLLFGRSIGLRSRAWFASLSLDLLLLVIILAGALAWWGQRLAQPGLPVLVLMGSVYVVFYAAGALLLELSRPADEAWLRRQLQARLRQRPFSQGTMAP